MPNSTRSLRVLVAEKDPALANVLSEFLQSEGHGVLRAVNGKHLGALATQMGGDACIVDTGARSTFELSVDQAAELRQVGKRIPVVVTTSRPCAERTSAAHLGVHTILTSSRTTSIIITTNAEPSHAPGQTRTKGKHRG